MLHRSHLHQTLPARRLLAIGAQHVQSCFAAGHHLCFTGEKSDTKGGTSLVQIEWDLIVI